MLKKLLSLFNIHIYSKEFSDWYGIQSVSTKRTKFVIFSMNNDFSYEVPIEYILKWYNPNFRPDVSILSAKVIEDNEAVEILVNETHMIFHWETIYMACEETYEEFGGLTEESKLMTENYFNTVKKFQTKPHEELEA